jgi:hypothetical protein
MRLSWLLTTGSAGDHLLPHTLGQEQIYSSLEEWSGKTIRVTPKPIHAGIRLQAVAAEVAVGLMHRWIVIHTMPDVVHLEIERITLDRWKSIGEGRIDGFEVMLLFQPERIHDLEFPFQF